MSAAAAAAAAAAVDMRFISCHYTPGGAAIKTSLVLLYLLTRKLD